CSRYSRSTLFACYSSISVFCRRPPPGSTLFPYTTLFRSYTMTTLGQVFAPLGGEDKDGAGQVGAVRRPAGASGVVRRRQSAAHRSEEHTSELQSRENLVCRLLLEKKKKKN